MQTDRMAASIDLVTFISELSEKLAHKMIALPGFLTKVTSIMFGFSMA